MSGNKTIVISHGQKLSPSKPKPKKMGPISGINIGKLMAHAGATDALQAAREKAAKAKKEAGQ